MSGQAERLFNIVSHYRPAPQSFFLAGSFFAAPIMPHYVNIALEDYFLAMLFVCRAGRLFDPDEGVGNVPHERGHKKHDKK